MTIDLAELLRNVTSLDFIGSTFDDNVEIGTYCNNDAIKLIVPMKYKTLIEDFNKSLNRRVISPQLFISIRERDDD